MTERIMLHVSGPSGFYLQDPAAELSGGLAISHKHRMAFGRIDPIPFHRHELEGEGPPQVGVAYIVDLEDEKAELRTAVRQYGSTRLDRLARYIVMGPVGSWATLLSASTGLSFGFWPLVRAVSEKGSASGLAFLIAWSIFYVPVIARSTIRVWHRKWAFALVVGVIMYMVVFLVGGGITYLGESIREIVERLVVWDRRT